MRDRDTDTRRGVPGRISVTNAEVSSSGSWSSHSSRLNRHGRAFL